MAILLETTPAAALHLKARSVNLTTYLSSDRAEVYDATKVQPRAEELPDESLEPSGRDSDEALPISEESEQRSPVGAMPSSSCIYAHDAFVPHHRGPTYTGYPAFEVGSYVPVPYSAGTVLYQDPVVDYHFVNTQNPYACNIPVGLLDAPRPSDCRPVVHPPNSFQLVEGGPYASDGFWNTMGMPALLYPALAMPNCQFVRIAPVYDNAATVQVGFVQNPPSGLRACAPGWIYQTSVDAKRDDIQKSRLPPSQPHCAVPVENVAPSLISFENGKAANGKKQYRRPPGAPVTVNGAALSSHPGSRRPRDAAAPTSIQVVTRSDGNVSSGVPEASVLDGLMQYKSSKHFVIKSFSEENVYKSIQHGVWASTVNGNHKLNAAFRDAQLVAAGDANTKCPVLLYFSVNGSGRFCGVAEMIGPVELKKTMEIWDRDKWSGSFPLKWCIVKDVPNSLLRRVTLQNNENKPVTSSRDTQEVMLSDGLEMLKIFRNHVSKVSILDRFAKIEPFTDRTDFGCYGDGGANDPQANRKPAFVKPMETATR